MARSQSFDFRKAQGHRGLAPAQIAGVFLAAFLAGIAAAGADISAPFAFFMALVAGAVLFIWKRSAAAALLLPLAFGAGLFYYHLYFGLRAARADTPPFGESRTFAGLVASEPGRSAKSEYFPMRLLAPHSGKVRVVAAPDSGFHYGDVLEVRGTIEPPELERDLPVIFFPEAQVRASGQGSPLSHLLLRAKARLLESFPRRLPPEEAAFLGGITLGVRADLSPEFRDALAASGTTHLVALSGYNIAILVFVVFGACLALAGRRPAFYLTTGAIFLFTLMVGAEPSVVRAAVMGCLALLARELGRPYGLDQGILWTAFFMVLYDPAALFLPGFQLSFMALLGIVHLSPVISSWFGAAAAEGAPVFLGGFRENAALTIAAQLAVVPVILNNFGAVSASSVPANALILPFMPLTMFFGFALSASSLLLAPLEMLAGAAAHVLLAYELGVIRFFAATNLPVGGSLSWPGIALYYLLLALLVRRHRLRLGHAGG